MYGEFSITNFLSQYSNHNNPSNQKIVILSTNNPEKLTKEISKYKKIIKKLARTAGSKKFINSIDLPKYFNAIEMIYSDNVTALFR